MDARLATARNQRNLAEAVVTDLLSAAQEVMDKAVQVAENAILEAEMEAALFGRAQQLVGGNQT